MNDILKCDMCGADAGNDPYHATIDENSHAHVCEGCFYREHYDLGVLWRERERILAKLTASESRLHEVSVFCATIEQQRDTLLEALCDFSEYVHNEQCSTDGAVQYSTTQINRLVFKARDAIAKATGDEA